MKKSKLLRKRTGVTALIGTIAAGLCPLLVAIVLTSLGLGSLLPIWAWLSAGLLAVGSIGFFLDFRLHGKPYPLIMFIAGAILLFVGRYSPYGGTGLDAWEIWGTGGLLIITAFLLNLKLRSVNQKQRLEA